MQGLSSAKVFDTIAYLRLYAVFIFVHRAHCIAFLAIRNITLMPTTLHHAQYITLNSHYAASDHITSQCSCSTSSYITLHLLYEISLMFFTARYYLYRYVGICNFPLCLHVHCITFLCYTTLHFVTLLGITPQCGAFQHNMLRIPFPDITLPSYGTAGQGRAFMYLCT